MKHSYNPSYLPPQVEDVVEFAPGGMLCASDGSFTDYDVRDINDYV